MTTRQSAVGIGARLRIDGVGYLVIDGKLRERSVEVIWLRETPGGTGISRLQSKGRAPSNCMMLSLPGPNLQYDLARLVWCARKHALRLARLRKRQD